MSNKIGEKFQITSFGSSHGNAVGAVVDGCPANLELSAEDNQPELLRPYMESLSFEDVRVLPDMFNANRFLTGRLPVGL